MATDLAAGTPMPSGYLQMACAAWYLYDSVLTLDDEAKYIWGRRWSFSKGLYFLIRLTTVGVLAADTVLCIFIENLSESQCVSQIRTYPRYRVCRCTIYSWGLGITTIVIIFEIDIVLQLRVWVLYQKSRRVLWINGGLFIVNLLIAVGMFAGLYSQEHFAPVPAYVQGACFDVRPAALGAMWVAPLCYEIHLTLMMVYKLARDRRLREHLDGPSLLSTLVRDSVVYFFLLVVLVGLNLFFYAATKVTPGDSASHLIHAAGGIGGARIILSMMKAVLDPVSPIGDTGVLSTTLEMRVIPIRSTKRPPHFISSFDAMTDECDVRVVGSTTTIIP